jgi:hypothetical protein
MSDETPVDDGKRLSPFAVAALALVVVVVAIFLVVSHNDNEAPFTPKEVHPKLVGLQVLTPTDAQGSNVTAALRKLGGSPGNGFELPNSHRRWQYVVGRVDIAGTAAPSQAQYEVIVVDNRLHRVVPSTYSYPEPHHSSGTGQGWDGADGSLRDRYDWQPSAVDQAAFFVPGSATSFPFVARLPAAALPVTDLHKDLTVVLAFTHGSDSVYWSIRLN